MTAAKPRKHLKVFANANQKHAQHKRPELLLTEHERSDLLYYWGGFATSLGFGSVHGAIESQLLRSPPRDRVAKTAVLDELIHNRELDRSKLTEVVRMEHGLTRFEIGRGINSLIQEGCATSKQDGVREWIVLHTIPKWAPIRGVSKEAKWARQDEELRQFCIDGMKCAQTNSTSAHNESRSASSMFERLDTIATALGRLEPFDRRVLERVYGAARPPVRSIDFGGDEIGRVVPLTHEAEKARLQVVQARLDAMPDPKPAELLARLNRSTVLEDAFAEIYDRFPATQTARDKFKALRDAFTLEARKEARKILITACAAYREARSCK